MGIYLEKQSESNPLIVRNISTLVLLVNAGRNDPRMGDFVPDVQGERPGYRVGRMNPAVEVKDVVRNVIGVDAIDGVADILASGDDNRKGEEDHRADAPV